MLLISFSKEVFSGGRASFPPPPALLGYVPLPTFCSYKPQTPPSLRYHATFLVLERHPRLRILSRKALENGIFYKKFIQVLANALLVLAIAK